MPARLADLSAPPKCLFLRGELPRGPAVAIVGTRYPSEVGAQFARRLAKELADLGIAVLSGGAEGIDTQAHLGALEADGVTVVVAPAGFERPFPGENAALFQDIVARGGAYLSLVEEGVPATRGAFFPRNACLVALAHAVVVVEAPIRSGARNAAANARRLGRPLFAVPYHPTHTNGRGCLAELQLGARCLIRTKDLLKALVAQNLHVVTTRPRAGAQEHPNQESLKFSETSPPADAHAAVHRAVESGAATADEIVVMLGLPAGRVSELILTLRLEGVLVTDSLGRLQIPKVLI
ncbi:MAG: DNA-processing protein DprA [Polyangiaceae bacterium]